MKVNQIANNIFYFFLGLTLLIIFTPFVESLFDIVIEKTKIDQVKESKILDVTLVLTLFLFISISVNKWQESFPSNSTTILIITIFILYTYQRVFNYHYIFTSFKIYPSLAYLDAIIPITLIYLGNYLKFFEEEKQSDVKQNLLYEDSPITDEEDDELENLFSKTVEKIQIIITENNFDISYTVGINSEWGGGKSSILKMLKNKLKRDSTNVIVDFNPWMGFDKKVLIKDFFNSLSESLTENNISDDISTYSEELINVTDNTILKSIKNIFYKEKSLETLFKNINDKIKLLNRKVIIIVDDVDRLDKEEVFQLLKLIRNTANFGNTYFILAYDREYVINSISEINNHSPINYIDKIINIELTLPYYNKNLLKQIFKAKLILKIGNKYEEKINFALENDMTKNYYFSDSNNGIYDDFHNWISNIRQVKKLVNSIYVNFNGFFEEINFKDLFYIEIIKLRYPYIYQLLYNQKDIILKNINGILFLREFTSEYIFHGEYLGEKKSGNTTKELTFEDTILGFLINEYCDRSNIIFTEKTKIQFLCLNLFTIKSSHTSTPHDYNKLSISNSYKFERYFSQTIFKSNISEESFNKFLNSSEEERAKTLKYWLENGKEGDLKVRLGTNTAYQNKNEFENKIKTILDIIKIDKNKFFWYPPSSFVNKLMFKSDYYLDKLYLSKNGLKKFILNVFSKPQSPYLFEAYVLSLAAKNKFKSDLELVLEVDEINSILKSYILNYLKENNFFDDYFWNLHNNCKIISYNENGFVITKIDDEIKKIILKKIDIDENFGFFVKKFIHYYSENIVRLREEIIYEFFDSIDDFEELFIEKINNSESFKREEFKKLYYEIKRNDWKDIEFNFNYLK